MTIQYYKSPKLSYSSRIRQRNISNITPVAIEEQYAVLLGDGATTTVKTSKDNICDYVTIDGTRWFVTSYVYMNGAQVQLNLQRDVIGEFGLGDMVGKVERGYTDSILKNRKELSLNQVLKKRIPLKPSSNTYGNYTISAPEGKSDVHDNELWGIMYFTKPSKINEETGQPYPNEVKIPILDFAPNYVEYPVIEDNSTYIAYNGTTQKIFQAFYSTFDNVTFYINKINYYIDNGGISFDYEVSRAYDNEFFNIYAIQFVPRTTVQASDELPLMKEICKAIGNYFASTNYDGNGGMTFPVLPNITREAIDYNGQTVLDTQNNVYYQYSASIKSEYSYGNINKEKFVVSVASCTLFKSFLDDKYIIDIVGFNTDSDAFDYSKAIEINSTIYYDVKTYTRTTLSNAEGGILVIDTNKQFIDEPYTILVFPLFDVNISYGSKKYEIKKSIAFNIFNSVIQQLSGENAYLVDAQVYPYCPVINKVESEINGYPFFGITSTSYKVNVSVDLLPNDDIKKEYIEREYSIVTPEQSDKFNFNYYDYYTKRGVARFQIKTSLKPFSIISSCVIEPDEDSLVGKTYQSDMRGAKPTSGGFECSLASDQFAQYKRQNSNYQQIFKLQQDSLIKQQQVERVNEVTQAVVNSVTATAMGAIGGASLGQGIGGKKGAAIGAGIGAGAAGAIVGTAMGIQVTQNDELREYEQYLQKQSFDLQIGTIKNLPISINRISSFNEIILNDFWYVIEVYECTDYEKRLVDDFISRYGYGIGVYGFLSNFQKDGYFLRGTLTTSSLNTNLHLIAEKEIMGGIYLYGENR